MDRRSGADGSAKLAGLSLMGRRSWRAFLWMGRRSWRAFLIFLTTCQVFCIVIFTFDYVMRSISSPAGPGYWLYVIGFANVIDLISILPFYIEAIIAAVGAEITDDLAVLSVLRLIRLTRITRIFKMSKNFQGLIILLKTVRKSAGALLMLFAFLGTFSVLFATLIYTAEMGTYDPYRKQYVREDGSSSPFESIHGALWWTFVTMTTVGYGDHYPVTVFGKIVAIMTMFCGLIVLSLPITIIGANFGDEYVGEVCTVISAKSPDDGGHFFAQVPSDAREPAQEDGREAQGGSSGEEARGGDRRGQRESCRDRREAEG